MKAAAQGTPNDLLRRACLLHVWSQKDVAEQIGVPRAFMINRWEKGLALPSLRYRQRLCTLFGKNAYELGFTQNGIEYPTKERVSLEDHPMASVSDPRSLFLSLRKHWDSRTVVRLMYSQYMGERRSCSLASFGGWLLSSFVLCK